jgi:transposase
VNLVCHFTSVKGRVRTSPRDVDYGESRIVVCWNKTRSAVPGGLLRLGSFTVAIPQVPARARTTRRLRTQIGAAIGEAAGSVTEAAIAHGVSRPTAHRALVAHAEQLLGEPEPTQVLGIEKTRRGKPRWEHCTHTGRWVRVDPWDTGFVDRAGDQGLLGQREGRTGATVIGWLSERSAPFREGNQYVAIDPAACYVAGNACRRRAVRRCGIRSTPRTRARRS